MRSELFVAAAAMTLPASSKMTALLDVLPASMPIKYFVMLKTSFQSTDQRISMPPVASSVMPVR